jgi:hypothetical protein
MNLHQALEHAFKQGKPIGFSPWRDGDGMLWGILTKVTATQITVDEISSIGEDDGEETYAISKISHFDFDALYSERLLRLRAFKATKPDDVKYSSKRALIREAIETAAQTGETLHLKFRAESGGRTVRVVWCDKTWAELADYDDLMQEQDREIWRISAITAVRWRTASEEADDFLLDRPFL